MVFSSVDVSEPGVPIFAVELSRLPLSSEFLGEPNLVGENSSLFSIEAITTSVWVVSSDEALTSGRYEFDVIVGYFTSTGPQSLLASAVVDITSQGKVESEFTYIM